MSVVLRTAYNTAGRLVWWHRLRLSAASEDVAVGAQQPIGGFFGFIQIHDTINKRRTSPGSWSQELSSHTKINEIRQWRPKWRQFKKVISLAGLHHTWVSLSNFLVDLLSSFPCSHLFLLCRRREAKVYPWNGMSRTLNYFVCVCVCVCVCACARMRVDVIHLPEPVDATDFMDIQPRLFLTPIS